MTSKHFLSLVLVILLSASSMVQVSAETCAEVCEECLADTEVTQGDINGTACAEECLKNIHLGTDNKQFIRAPMWKKCYTLIHELRSKQGPYLIMDSEPRTQTWKPALAVCSVTVLVAFIVIAMVTIKVCVRRAVLRKHGGRQPTSPNGTMTSTALMANMEEEETQKARPDDVQTV
ncbi:PREDICTED: uncharacterized protein LOC109479891 [Branchiostoma belcheri]|uniref:Uncharacterized protein LOC109479891 n=1 Tax=Branchiostoma belcheri TaxID=7741 RepID=A0A6P4Z7V0_BRABE|nr:PREDICTED: uncharacterized protein LOC109479891 [Branchiostoma belcheri]XP_019637500.1 PREDICTED: uncharacterized protein LOC109479891 [Branchiostoma belcheri]